ncbi:hypothetical protein BDV96DRAFT_583665 [Lophiotrema nucula]|uniref:Uncharacterized protein n=1 Tax=Lophiotrema nucula TaxID=690887 RepID=A0A6A5YUD2_9PLEO|nr:hypothetical protein BDV96DRAFT_583665 [Lophiotrema nucula]
MMSCTISDSNDTKQLGAEPTPEKKIRLDLYHTCVGRCLSWPPRRHSTLDEQTEGLDFMKVACSRISLGSPDLERPDCLRVTQHGNRFSTRASNGCLRMGVRKRGAIDISLVGEPLEMCMKPCLAPTSRNRNIPYRPAPSGVVGRVNCRGLSRSEPWDWNDGVRSALSDKSQ